MTKIFDEKLTILLRLVLIEKRNQLINPDESIEFDIKHHLSNLSYGTDIQGNVHKLL